MSDPPGPRAGTATPVDVPPAEEQGGVEGAAVQADPRSRLARLLDTGAGRNLGLVAVLVVLCVIGVATADTFATTSKVRSRRQVMPCLPGRRASRPPGAPRCERADCVEPPPASR